VNPGLRTTLLGALGIVLMLASWEVAGQAGWLGPSWPPVSEIVRTLTRPSGRDLYARALTATGRRAALGYGIGVAGAVVAACVTVLVPRSRRSIERLAAGLHTAPWIALGPLFVVVFPRWVGPVAIAVLAVFFTVFVSATTGLAAASPSQQQLFHAFGAGRIDRFVHLEAPQAVPAILDGMRLAAPAALVGTIFGEWFGADRGIGPLLVSAMQNYRIERLWAAAVLAALVSLAMFGALTVLRAAVVRRLR
jgi:ABC-type nitrate/sulfonate/bicarbonate transport system permease component